MASGAEDVSSEIQFPIGNYRVQRLLGRGGIGEVFVAQRRGSSQLCALKTLRPDIQSKRAALARIRREAHVASLLNHDNICRILDAGFDGSTFFLASEFVDGVDLDRIISALAQRGLALALDVVQEVMLQVLAGLIHAHEATDSRGQPMNLVHRDLSPRNIMVTFDGQVKLIDFGVAYATVDDYRTRPGVLVGTVKYLSPEQALGEPIDARSDLYTLGTVLYEMLTGRSAVVGGQGLIEALKEIAATRPRALHDYNPNVPHQMVTLIDRALEKERDDRFASARQMSAALEGVPGRRSGREAVGRLVRELFPELADELQTLIESSRERATEVRRFASAVDPFSSTAVGPHPEGEQESVATRTGRPDEFEDPQTATTFLYELEETAARSVAVLPTRQILPSVGPVPDSPYTMAGTTRTAYVDNRPTTLRPPPSSLDAKPPPPWRNLAIALFGGATLVVVGLLVVQARQPRTLSATTPANTPKAAPVTVVAATPSAQPATPSAQPVAAPAAAPRTVDPSRASRTPRPPPRRTARPAPAEPPVSKKTPTRRSDPAARALRKMRRHLENGGTVDFDALSGLIDHLTTRAGDDRAARSASRAAQDCLSTCSSDEQMVRAAQRALEAVLKAERKRG